MRSVDRDTVISQLRVGAYHCTLGSRNSLDPMSRTGFPAYLVQVRPRSVLYARDWACRPSAL
ncbi:hypothetical protein GCM10023237_09210 [Streptomyces coeruleoprunus]